jgi:ribosome-associated protein
VNKTDTKAQLIFYVRKTLVLDEGTKARLLALAGARRTSDDAIVVSSEEHRSQSANKDECVRKLGELGARARHVPKRRRKTRPTRGSVERRLSGKASQSEKKRDRKVRYDAD